MATGESFSFVETACPGVGCGYILYIRILHNGNMPNLEAIYLGEQLPNWFFAVAQEHRLGHERPDGRNVTEVIIYGNRSCPCCYSHRFNSDVSALLETMRQVAKSRLEPEVHIPNI